MIHAELLFKFKTTMSKQSLCNCIDTFVLSKAVARNNKHVIFKSNIYYYQRWR